MLIGGLAALALERSGSSNPRTAAGGVKNTAGPILTVYLRPSTGASAVERILATARGQHGYHGAHVISSREGVNLMRHCYPNLSIPPYANPLSPAINLRLQPTADPRRYSAQLVARHPSIIVNITALRQGSPLDVPALIPR